MSGCSERTLRRRIRDGSLPVTRDAAGKLWLRREDVAQAAPAKPTGTDLAVRPAAMLRHEVESLSHKVAELERDLADALAERDRWAAVAGRLVGLRWPGDTAPLVTPPPAQEPPRRPWWAWWRR